MKKIFAFVAAALIASSAMALDGVNVMASGLKSTLNDDGTMAIEFVLNTAATSIEIEFFDEAGDLVSLVTPNDASLLTAGAHQTTITIPEEDLEPGTYTWGIHAYGAATTFADLTTSSDVRYKYYMPRDVLVDNSFESEYFGRVYVSEATIGNADNDAGSETTANQTRGIYIYDTQMNFVNGQQEALIGYDGGIGGDSTSTVAFRRLAIDESGYVYVCSLDDSTKGVYRMDPANPQNRFVQVLAANEAVDAIEAKDGKLYTLEGVGVGTGSFNSYDLSTIPVDSALKSYETMENGLANSHITIRSDKRNGFWVVQYRGQFDDYTAAAHWTKKGKLDYNITPDMNLLSESSTTQRGAMAVSIDGSMLAIGSGKRVIVLSVVYDEAGIPTLSKLCETPQLGTNIDGVAFDAADNLYIVSASSERLYVFPIAKETSNCRVMAASRYAFVLEDETPLPTAPETAPAAPTQPEADVMAIYCNHYATNNANFGISGWAGAYDILDIDGTIIAAWKSMSWECIIDPAHTDDPHDFSAYENIHVDMWAPAAAKIKFTAEAVAGGNYKDGQVLDLSEGWNSFDIAVADWAGGYDFTNLKCFVLENYQTPEGASFEGNAFAVANVYFWKKVSAVDNVNVDTQAVKFIRNGQVLILRNGTEYNLLGSEMK